MNLIHTNQFYQWETRLALVLIVSTPLLISTATYDSFLLPKFVGMTVLASLWLWMHSMQTTLLNRMPSALDKPFLAMGMVFAASVLINFTSALQIEALLICGVFVGLFYAFRSLWSRGLSEEKVALALLVTATILSIYGLFQDAWAQTGQQDFFPTSGGVRDWRARVIATLGNPNFLGGYLGVSLPVLIAYALRRELAVWQYGLCAIALMLIVACMTVTFCVGVTVGLIIAVITGILMMLWTRSVPTFSWVRGMVLFLLLMSANLWYTLDNPYNTHGTSLFLEAKSSPHWASGMGARNFNWRTSLIMMEENPLTGIGFGNYLTKHIHYQGINYQNFGTAHDRDYVIPVDQPHFQLLETATECGPLGVFAICWVFCAWWKAAYKRLKPNHKQKITWQSFLSAVAAIGHPVSVFPIQKIQSQKNWFAWGAFLGVITAVGHSFSSFPFHLPATSLEVVVLASWFAAKPTQIQPKTVSVPVWKMSTASVGALIVIYLAGTHYISDVYLRLGNESQGVTSIAYLKQAVQYNPYSYQNHFVLANRYTQMGWYDEALKSYQNALQYQEDLKAHEYMARIHALQEDFENAIEEQKRVIELNPVYPGHYRDLIGYMKQAGVEDGMEKLEAKAQELDEEIQEKYGR